MGNEQTKDRDLNMNGKVLVNGVSANITPNGMKIDANGKTIVQQNGGPKSFDLSTESTDYVVVESDSPHADTPIISETLETVTQTEQVNESKGEKVNFLGKTFEKTAEPPADVKIVQGKETLNEEQTSVSPPATDPQLELDSCGCDAAAVITTDLGEDEKTGTSTQTDRKADTNISTQTGDEGQTPRVEGPMEEVAMVETAATEEDTPAESAAVIAEEVVEVTADVGPSDSQTAGIIIEEVVIINNDVYENIELRVEQMEVTDSFEISPHKNCDPEEETTNETEAEIAEEPETNPNKFSVGGETVDEDHILDEAFPLEISSRLPKEEADCAEAVLSAAPESSYIAAVNKMEPSVHEVITDDNNEGASELSADAVLIELALSESSAVTPEVMESNGFPSFEEELAHTIMETNSEVVCEESNQTPANQVVPKEEPSIPLQVEHDEAVAAEDVPEISEELLSAEAPSNKHMTTEELLKDTSSFPKDESKSESILEIIASDESAEVSGDVMADVRPKTAQEEELGSVIVKDDTEVTLEAAIDALSQDFELSPITSEMAAVENGIPLIEELITATTFVPLSREQDANLPVPETVAEEMNRYSTEALSNEFNAVPDNVKEVTIVQEPTPGEVTKNESGKSVEEVSEDVLAQVKTPEQFLLFSEKPTEENPSICEEAATTEVLMEELLADSISEKPEVIEIIAEEPAAEQADVPWIEATAECEPCISVQEFVEENAALTEPQDIGPVISEELANLSPFQQQVGLLKTTDDKNKDETTHERDNSCEVFAAFDKKSEYSQIPTLDEPVAESVEAPLATAGDDIITEDAMAVCDNLTLEKTAPEIIPEGETEEKTKSESNVNATASDMEALPVGLHSTFTSVTEATMDKLEDTENIFEELADEHNDDPQSVTTAESAPCNSVQEELVEENVAKSVSAVEETTDSGPDNSEEPVEENASLLETQEDLVEILKTTEDEVTDKSTPESDTSDDVSASVNRSSEVSQISTSDKPVAECVEAVAHSTLEVDVIREDVTAEFNLLTMENTASEIILEGEAEERAESESNVNSAEDIPEKLEVTEHIFEEPAEEQAGVKQMEVTRLSVQCFSVQEELVEENVDKSVVAVEETTDSSPVNSEEPVEENVSHLEAQEDLVEILKTTEDEVTDKSAPESDTSDDVSASVDKGSEVSHISTSDEPVAECVEAVLDTVVDEIITEEVMAECNLLTLEKTAPEIMRKGETEESNVNPAASTHSAILIEDTPVTSKDIEVLPVLLESACATTDETTSDKVEDTENIVEEPAEEQADVPQIEAPGESVPNISVQEETVEENVDNSVVAVEKPTDSSPGFSEEPVEGNVSHLEVQVLVENLETTEDEATDVSAQKTDTSGNDVVAVDKKPVDSQISTSDEPVAECAEAVLDINVNDVTTEDVMAECNLMSSEEVVLEEPAEEHADVPQIEAPGEPVQNISVQEETVEENYDNSVVAVEETTYSSPDFSEEPVEGNVSHDEVQVLVENLETTEDEATDVSAQKTDTFDNVSAAADKNSEDSQISTSDEPVAECVEAVLDTIAEDINTEDVMAECNLVTLEKTAPETIHKGVTEERAESESNVNSAASTESAEMIEDTPVTSTDMGILPVRLQSVCITAAEDISEKLEDTKKVLEEPAEEHTDTPPMEVTGGSVPCISVQEEPVEENVPKSVVALEETTDSSPVNFEKHEEKNLSPLETQENLLILKTTEDEVTDKSAHEIDTFDDTPAFVDRSSEDSPISTSDESVAECVESVLDNIMDDIITENVMAECNLVSSEEVVPETIYKGENGEKAESESNVNSTASMHCAEMTEDSPVTATYMEVLPVRLHLAFTSVTEATSDKLEDTENIIEELTDEQADEPRMEDTRLSVQCFSVEEELVEEYYDKSVVAVEGTTVSSPVNSEEPVEGNVSLLELQEDLVEILKTTEDEVTDKSTPESDTSDDVSASVDRSSEDSHISISDEPVAECAVLDTVVDEVITEKVTTECNLLTPENTASEIMPEGETEGRETKSESNVNPAALTQSAILVKDIPVTSTDMEPAKKEADVPQIEEPGESVPNISVQEETVEENYDNSVVAVEKPTDSSPGFSEEPVEGNVSHLEVQVLVENLETTEDEARDVSAQKTDTSGNDEVAVDKNPVCSQIPTSDEPVAECAEAVLDTIVDDIITENVTAACNLVSSEGMAPETIYKGENGEKAESESNVNSTASMHCADNLEDSSVTATDVEALPMRLHSTFTSVTEVTMDKLLVTINMTEEPADWHTDVPQSMTTAGSVPCVSVQEELVEENVAKSAVAVDETTDSIPVKSEEPVEENLSPIEPQEDLVEILKTTEDEVTDKSTHESSTSDDILVSVDRSSEVSQISTSDEPVAEYVEAVLDTITDDIITEDVTAECNLMSSEGVAPETIHEGENGEKAESESNVNSTTSLHIAEMIEDTPVTSTDMEVLPVRLHLAVTSVTEATSDKLQDTENIIEEPADEQADVPQMEATRLSVQCFSVEEELVEENVVVVAVEETIDSSPANSEEPVKENFSLLEPQEDLVEILKTTEDEVTGKTTHESDTSDDVSFSVDRSSEVSHISTSDEPVAECVEAFVDSTVAEDIITEDVIAECNLMTLEKVTLKIIAEEETEEKAEGESNVNSTASTQSAQLIEDTPVATTDMEVLLVRLESVCATALEAIPEKLEVTENLVRKSTDEQADVPQMEVTGEFVPCVSVQEELVDENVAKSVVLKPKDYSPVDFEEPVEESVSPLEPQEDLVEILKTTKDEVTDKSTHEIDTSDYVLAEVDENLEDSQISAFSEPVAECVKAVVDSTVADDIISEDVTAECYIVTLEKTAPEIIAEEKTNVISAASTQNAEMIEDTPLTSTDMEVLPVSLESACTRALEVIPVGLEVTENLFEEPAEEQADAPPMEVTGESVPCVSVQEEPVEDNVTISVVALEETTDSSPVNFEEPVERSESSLEPQEDLLILKTTQDKFTEKSTCETDKSEKNSEDSHISTSDEPVTECVEVVVDTISEDITTEDITAECNMTLVRVVPEIVTEGDTAEMAESESHATALTQTAEKIGNTPVTSTDMEALLETANLKQERESLTEPESVTVDAGPEEEKAPETDNGNSQSVENQEDSDGKDIPIMNFFKTLVSSTKTKKETATPDATKDKSQKESQPAAATTVAQVSEPPAAPKAMSVPPPPPPEPPKMEIKGEPAAKLVKPSPKEEPKAAAKEPESSKGISARDSLGRFFRKKVLLSVKASKGKGASASGADAPARTAPGKMEEKPEPAVEVEVQQEVEVQETPLVVQQPVADIQHENNAEPLETAAEVTQVVVEEQTVEEVAQPVVEAEKVDPSKAGTLEASPKPEPPPPVQEEKKTASKSAFMSLFKPKAADPKKATPAPAAAAEAAQTAKAKEEPKAAAKSSEAAVENKPASAASKAGDDAAEAPKKQEKRNSITLLFKILGQKRNSTDAGVQTEPVTVAPAAEKAK